MIEADEQLGVTIEDFISAAGSRYSFLGDQMAELYRHQSQDRSTARYLMICYAVREVAFAVGTFSSRETFSDVLQPDSVNQIEHSLLPHLLALGIPVSGEHGFLRCNDVGDVVCEPAALRQGQLGETPDVELIANRLCMDVLRQTECEIGYDIDFVRGLRRMFNEYKLSWQLFDWISDKLQDEDLQNKRVSFPESKLARLYVATLARCGPRGDENHERVSG